MLFLSPITQEKGSDFFLGIFKVTAMDEHLGETMATSVLAAIMTYANLRLSAELSLFVGRVGEMRGIQQSRLKAEKAEDRNLAAAFYLCGFGSADHGILTLIGTLWKLEELI